MKALFIAQPLPASKLFHVFDKKDNRSLCEKYAILRPNPDACEEVVGDSYKYQKGQDCKSCFEKLIKEVS